MECYIHLNGTWVSLLDMTKYCSQAFHIHSLYHIHIKIVGVDGWIRPKVFRNQDRSPYICPPYVPRIESLPRRLKRVEVSFFMQHLFGKFQVDMAPFFGIRKWKHYSVFCLFPRIKFQKILWILIPFFSFRPFSVKP